MVRIPEQGYIPLCFQLVQNDKDVYGLTIHITDGVTEIDYSQILRATIAFSKSDGTVVQGNLTKGAGGAFTYTMGTNEIACPGDVLTSIQLIGAANERLTTARFKFNVVRDLITPSAVQSVSEFAILQQLVEDVNQLKQDIVNLQVPDNSLMDTKLSGAAGQIKTRFADHVTDFDALAAEVTAHKADNMTDADGVHGLRIQEDTWTPSLGGDATFGNSTYAVRSGSYIRIGKLCYVEGAITLSAKDPAMAGSVYVSGFPFAPNSPAGQQAVLSVSRVGGITYPTGYTQLSLPMSQAVPSAFLNVSGSGLAVSGLNATYISNTSAIRFSGFYITA
jgi:hypothetical protein